MIVSAVVACDKTGLIGGKNQLLWHLSEDLKRFKRLTSGHPIIMGRKTYESIGRVLPGRTNIVITRQPDAFDDQENLIWCASLDNALEQANVANGNDEVFIIGGGEIYRQALSKCDRVYLTIVDGTYEGDTFFPLQDFMHAFQIEDMQDFAAVGDQVGHRFIVANRRSDTLDTIPAPTDQTSSLLALI